MPHGAVPFPFGDCRVCVDKATGVHYGVATCEGCKGFFKRSIPKADRYKCFFGGSCILSPQNRNRCKACRFQRCLQVGMSTDAVKMGRIPKVDKERALQEVHDTQSFQPAQPTSSQQPHSQPPSHTFSQEPASQLRSSYMCQLPSDPLSSQPQPLMAPSGVGSSVDPLAKMEHMNSDFLLSPDGDRPIGDMNHLHDSHSRPAHSMFNNSSESDSSFMCDGSQNNFVGRDEPPAAYINGEAPEAPFSQSSALQMQMEDVPQGLPSNALFSHLTGGKPFTGHKSMIPPWSDHQNHMTKFSDFTTPHGIGHEQNSAPFYRQTASSSPETGSDSGIARNLDKSAEPELSPGGENSPGLSRPPGPFSPTIIKELLTQVIQSGHGPDLEKTIKNQFFGPEMEMKNRLLYQKAHNDILTVMSQLQQKMHVKKEQIDDEDDDHMTTQLRSMKRSMSEGGLVGPSSHGHKVLRAQSSVHHQLENGEQHLDMSSFRGLEFGDMFDNLLGGGDNVGGGLNHWLDMRQGADVKRSEFTNNHPDQNLFNTGMLTDQLIQSVLDTGVDPRRTVPGGHDPASLTDISEQKKDIGLSFDAPHSQMSGDMISNNQVSSSIISVAATSSSHDLLDQDNTLHAHNSTTSSPTSSNAQTDNPKVEVEKMEIDRIDMDMTLKRFDQVYYNTQKRIRMDEHFMKLELAEKLPIHPLNKLNIATRVHVQHVWNLLLSTMPVSNQLIFGLCQSVPHFCDITKEDQAILLREAYFPIWLISHAKLFYKGESYLRFKCQARYSRWWMNHILPVSLIDSMHKFTNELNSFKLTGREIIALCCVQLVNPERNSLTDITRIQQIHDRYLDILAYLIDDSHKSSHGRVLMRILRLLPTLEPLNREQREIIGNFSLDSPVPEGQLLYSESAVEEEEDIDYKELLDFSMYEEMDPD